MRYETERKIRLLRLIAKTDERYNCLMKEYNQLETEFAEITQKLTTEEQDILWAFVCISDEVDHRLLEIICDGIQL